MGRERGDSGERAEKELGKWEKSGERVGIDLGMSGKRVSESRERLGSEWGESWKRVGRELGES